ncbi:MAG: efflux RND transporter periplasmic adaptor subunit [Planctomycetota bacterium]
MRRTITVFILVAAGLISFIYYKQGRTVPFVVSGFIEADEIRVGSRVGGRVAEVLVVEGQRVKSGQPLFRIDPFDLQEQAAQARATLAASRAQHERLKAGYRPEEIEQARAKRDQIRSTLERLTAGPRPQEIEIARELLKVAEASLELAESEYARLERLKQESQAAPKEFDEAVRSLKTGRANVAASQKQLALLVEGTRKEEIAQARAALAEAEQVVKVQEQGYRKEDIAQAGAEEDAAAARVAAMEKQLKELVVLSPGECVVETIDLRPGDLVAPNAPALSLLDLSKMWVRAYVPESRLGEVRLDQRVPIRVDNFPEKVFASRVSFISREAEFTPKNVQTPEERSKQVFRIKATLEEGLDQLRVGMAADVMLDEKHKP